MLPFATSKPTPFFSFVDGHPGLLIVPNCTSAGQRPHVDAHGSKQRRTDRRGDLRQESRLLPDALAETDAVSPESKRPHSPIWSICLKWSPSTELTKITADLLSPFSVHCTRLAYAMPWNVSFRSAAP